MKLGEQVAFCLPSAGRRTQLFHLIFTKPGAHLLVHPCRASGRERDRVEGALWCHIITLLCAAGDWISGWGRRRDRRDGGSSSISSAKILSRRDIRAPKVESFSLAAAAASLLPFVCLSGALSWPLQEKSRCGLADLTSRENIAPPPSLTSSAQKESEKSRRLC